MPDLDQPELAALAAQATVAPSFEALLRRARRRRRTAVLGAGLAVTLVAVGGAFGAAGLRTEAGPVGPSATSPPVTSSPTTDPSTPTETTPSSVPKWIPTSGACPTTHLEGLPAGSGCASLGRGDFDGDGSMDLVVAFAYPLDAKGFAQGWYVRFIPGGPARSPLSMRLPVTQTNMRIEAVVDVNRDGRDDALLDYQDGATTNDLEIVTVSRGHLDRMGGPEGVPFGFTLGGSVEQGSGARCRLDKGIPEVVDLGYFERSGAFRRFENIYRWHGTSLMLVDQEVARIAEADVGKYSQFHCFGLDWPVNVPAVRAR